MGHFGWEIPYRKFIGSFSRLLLDVPPLTVVIPGVRKVPPLRNHHRERHTHVDRR